jgi:hypothetical protein
MKKRKQFVVSPEQLRAVAEAQAADAYETSADLTDDDLITILAEGATNPHWAQHGLPVERALGALARKVQELGR